MISPHPMTDVEDMMRTENARGGLGRTRLLI